MKIISEKRNVENISSYDYNQTFTKKRKKKKMNFGIK